MTTSEQPDSENPFESPQTTDVAAEKRRRRGWLIVLGIFLVPLAAVIGGFVTCWAGMMAASTFNANGKLDVLLVVGEIAFMVGAIAAGIATVRLLQRWSSK